MKCVVPRSCPPIRVPGRWRARRRRAFAFTLMEMILVLAIISVLLGLGVFGLVNVLGGAKEDAAASDIRTLEMSLVRYASRSGSFPTEAQGLDALVNRPTQAPVPQRWQQMVEPKVLIDPWNRPYQYRIPAQRSAKEYDVFSLGADGIADTEDDIGNWE